MTLDYLNKQNTRVRRVSHLCDWLTGVWIYLCVGTCSCHSPAAPVAAALAPAAAPPSGCSLCGREGSEPPSVDPPPPWSCKRTTGWDGSQADRRRGGGRGLSQHCAGRRFNHNSELVISPTVWNKAATHLPSAGSSLATSSSSILVPVASCSGFRFGCSMSSVRPKQSSSTNRAEAEGSSQYLRYRRSRPRGSRQVQAAAFWIRSCSSRT